MDNFEKNKSIETKSYVPFVKYKEVTNSSSGSQTESQINHKN